MSIAGFMWECSCGNAAYGENAPEECEKCHKIDNFIKLPEEIEKEIEKDLKEEEYGRKSKPRKTAKRTRRISR